MRYLFFGGVNTAFSYGLYTVFLLALHALAVPGDFLWATSLSWLISNATSFVLQRKFVFRSTRGVTREFVKFSSVTFGSFLANIALGAFAVGVLGLTTASEKLVSQLVITVVLVLATYVLHKFFSFGSPSVDAEVLGTSAVERGPDDSFGSQDDETDATK